MNSKIFLLESLSLFAAFNFKLPLYKGYVLQIRMNLV